MYAQCENSSAFVRIWSLPDKMPSHCEQFGNHGERKRCCYKVLVFLFPNCCVIMGGDVIAKDHPPTSKVLACHVGITDCRKLEKIQFWNGRQSHNLSDKFHGNKLSHSPAVIRVRKDRRSELNRRSAGLRRRLETSVNWGIIFLDGKACNPKYCPFENYFYDKI
jgi:hypothetical protein